jgi:hypothetical protein
MVKNVRCTVVGVIEGDQVAGGKASATERKGCNN